MRLVVSNFVITVTHICAYYLTDNHRIPLALMKQFNLFPVTRGIEATIHGQHILYTNNNYLRQTHMQKKTIHIMVTEYLFK